MTKSCVYDVSSKTGKRGAAKMEAIRSALECRPSNLAGLLLALRSWRSRIIKQAR